MKPKGRFAYIAPTYKQAKNIAWDYVKEFAEPIPGKKVNESELRVDLPNGSRIQLFGSDNPDSLRGLKFHGVIFDEYSQQPAGIFTEIVRPALTDTKGYAIWIGTPKGKNDFYQLWTDAKKNERYFTLMLRASESGLIDDKELEDARSVMSEDEYQQEFECSFEAAVQGAYYSQQMHKMREDNRITKVPYDELMPVHTWWDLGVNDSTTIGFFQKAPDGWRLIDSYENSGEGLQHYIKVVKEKGYIYGEHHAPHDIKVRELGSGKSRYETARELGITFNIVPNLPIEDGINAVRMRLGRLWIDEEKCADVIEALMNYHKEWDEKRGVWKARPVHDWSSHYADMMRYWAVTEVWEPNARAKMRVFENRASRRSMR